jgi:hypothetical protein
MKKKIGSNSRTFYIIGYLISIILFWYIMKYIFLWVPSLANLLENIQTPLMVSKTWKIVGLLTAIVIAITLYHIKKRMLIIFGLIEISGGGWAIWATFTQDFENSVLYALAIAGGIFFIINGFENIVVENDKKRKNVQNKL